MLEDNIPFPDDDEGEAFDFDDSSDDIPEAGCPPPAPPSPPPAPSSKDHSQDNMVASHPEGHLPDPPTPSTTLDTALSSADATVATNRSFAAGGSTAGGERTGYKETDLPPPPPPPFDTDTVTDTDPRQTGLQQKC